MSNLDDLKDELEFEVNRLHLAGERPIWTVPEIREAVEIGWLQLDAGATYGEALAAAKIRLKKAVAA